MTYGAHGIWNWQKINKPANPILGEGFDSPFPWEEAIQFPGAWDYGFIRSFLSDRKIRKLIPANGLLDNSTPEIRMARTEDGRFLLYLPYSTTIKIRKELPGCTVKAFDLDSGKMAWTDSSVREGNTVIEMHPFHSDALLLIEQEIRGSVK